MLWATISLDFSHLFLQSCVQPKSGEDNLLDWKTHHPGLTAWLTTCGRAGCTHASAFPSSRAKTQANLYRVETLSLLSVLNQKQGYCQLISSIEYLPVGNRLVTSDLICPLHCASQRLNVSRGKSEEHSIFYSFITLLGFIKNSNQREGYAKVGIIS